MWAIGMFLIGKTLIPIYSAPMNLYINFTNQKEWRRYFIESKVQSFDLIYSYFFVTSNFCHLQSGSNLVFLIPTESAMTLLCVCLFVCFWFVSLFVCYHKRKIAKSLFSVCQNYMNLDVSTFYYCQLFTPTFLPQMFMYPHFFNTPTG